MSGDDDRLICDCMQVPLSGLDHSIDAAVRRVIDKWINAVPPCITHVEDVGFFKKHADVAIGVSGAVIPPLDIGVVVVAAYRIAVAHKGVADAISEMHQFHFAGFSHPQLTHYIKALPGSIENDPAFKIWAPAKQVTVGSGTGKIN